MSNTSRDPRNHATSQIPPAPNRRQIHAAPNGATKALDGALNPTGLCRCGCGETTPIAPVTSAKRGWRKGQHVQYVKGHSARVTNRTRELESRVPITPTDNGHPTPCLIWGGAVNSKGYPTKGDGAGGSILAHRAAYEAVHGPLPVGMHLHHLCGQPRCLNVDHLIALSQRDHNRLHAWLRREALSA